MHAAQRAQIEALEDVIGILRTHAERLTKHVRQAETLLSQANALDMAQVDAHAYIQWALDGVNAAIMELRSAISESDQAYPSLVE